MSESGGRAIFPLHWPESQGGDRALGSDRRRHPCTPHCEGYKEDSITTEVWGQGNCFLRPTGAKGGEVFGVSQVRNHHSFKQLATSPHCILASSVENVQEYSPSRMLGKNRGKVRESLKYCLHIANNHQEQTDY